MTKLVNWVKDNKLASFLLLIVFFFLVSSLNQNSKVVLPMSRSTGSTMEFAQMDAGVQSSAPMAIGKTSIVSPNMAPPSSTQVRMVTTDTNVSLKVDDVPATLARIEATANQAGGYLIDSSVNKPEGAASGTISIRVPSEKRSEVLASVRGFAVKVVAENVNGQDITDQYVDNDERLRILESTKVKFQAILSEAKNVQDMLEVQRELLSLQSQIDSIKGQQKYLEGSAKLTRITIYLSTDELSLPYAPDTAWRPTLVFKEAVRSLLMTLRQVGSLAIWMVVYAPVVIVVGIVLFLIKKITKK